MQLGKTETRIYKFLLCLYVFSLTFFDKAIFFGYDSPYLYVGSIIFLAAIVFRKDVGIVLPKAVFFWLLFLATILLYSFSAISQEKILSNAARLALTIVISLSIYNLLRSYQYSITDTLKFYVTFSVLLSIFAVFQFVEFNFFRTFRLYLPPTNLTFTESGGPGAVAGGVVIFRATGTFAEPSWLAYYLIPAFMLAIVRYLETARLTNLILTLVIFVGMLSTLSVTALILSTIATTILIFTKFLWPLLRLKLLPRRFLSTCLLGITVLSVIFLGWNYGLEANEYLTNRLETLVQELDPSAAIRYSTIKEALALFKLSPLLGIGAGNYPFAASRFLGVPADISIDSGFFLILAEMGLIGLVTFSLVLWQSFRPILKINSSLKERLFWLLLSQVLLLISYNWWYHPLLWLHLTLPLVLRNRLQTK